MVRQLSGAQRDALIDDMGQTDQNGDYHPKPNASARYCVATICDRQGQLLFEKADMVALAEKEGAALERIYSETKTFNGFGRKLDGAAVKNSD